MFVKEKFYFCQQTRLGSRPHISSGHFGQVNQKVELHEKELKEKYFLPIGLFKAVDVFG